MADSNTTSINWNTIPTATSNLSIGTHTLHLTISGPPRPTPKTPLILIFCGSGDITLSWTRVQSLISPHHRILVYDRSGLGLSQPRPKSLGPIKHTAVTAAEDLIALLKAAELEGPYVICAHSYGAIIAREFLHLKDKDVVGMVLAEASQERQYTLFRVPDENIMAISKGVKESWVTGLKEDSNLSREEWRERAIQISNGKEATWEEAMGFIEVCKTLEGKRQMEGCVLGDRPLSVVRCHGKRDFERVFEAGVEMGNGTEQQRREFKALLDRWDEADHDLKTEQLKLSRNSRYVHISDCGHNVQLTRPDVVAKEIRWVMDSIEKKTAALL
ncbi:alpha/beta hydrolase [Halenospora varia]|nr:alpha/beta hydrolase [Halenospora varia]